MIRLPLYQIFLFILPWLAWVDEGNDPEMMVNMHRPSSCTGKWTLATSGDDISAHNRTLSSILLRLRESAAPVTVL